MKGRCIKCGDSWVELNTHKCKRMKQCKDCGAFVVFGDMRGHKKRCTPEETKKTMKEMQKFNMRGLK